MIGGKQAMSRSWMPGRKKKNRSIADRNLYLLVAGLPGNYRAALSRIGVRIEWHNRKKISGASDYHRKTIELSTSEFCRFKYSADEPSQDQRWCVATLKEEIIHYVATHTGFDSSAAWKSTVESENKKKSTLRNKLFRKQREYDSSEDEIKCDAEEYTKRERSEEWLVDVLLVRDYLSARGMAEDTIEQILIEAFPGTYPLALAFERAALPDLRDSKNRK
jgi:hypothetical protein